MDKDWIECESMIVGYGLSYNSLFVSKDSEGDEIPRNWNDIDEDAFNPRDSVKFTWIAFLVESGYSSIAFTLNIEPHIGVSRISGSSATSRKKNDAMVVFGSKIKATPNIVNTEEVNISHDGMIVGLPAVKFPQVLSLLVDAFVHYYANDISWSKQRLATVLPVKKATSLITVLFIQ